MTSGDSLRQVAQLVDALENAGVGVEDVTITEDGDDSLADLSVRLPDGGAHLDELAVAPPVESAEPASESGDGPRSAASGATETADGPSGDHPEEQTGGDEHPSSDATPGAAADGGDEQGNDGSAGSDGSERSKAESSAVADRPDGSSESGESSNESDESEPTDAVPCRLEGCDRTFESAHGMKIHAAKSHDSEEATDTQPHRDPERLQAVYDREETFEEMQRALETDVTAQTVRRNMMKFGIHEPDSNPVDGYAAVAAATEPGAIDAADGDETPDESGDGAGSEPAQPDDDEAESHAEAPSESDVETAAGEHGEDTVADGGPGESRSLADVTLPDSMTLPEGVDLESLATATRESRTLYEFAESLDVDRPTAQELLAAFDLLELVTGRLGNRPEQELREDEVAHRILEAVDARSTGGGTGASAD